MNVTTRIDYRQTTMTKPAPRLCDVPECHNTAVAEVFVRGEAIRAECLACLKITLAEYNRDRVRVAILADVKGWRLAKVRELVAT